MTDPFPFDVFLSHSAKDKPILRALAERLRADGSSHSRFAVPIRHFKPKTP